MFDVYDEPVHCPAERCLTSWWYFGSLAVTPSVNDNVSNFISQKHKRRSRREWATGSPKFDVEVTLYILSMTPESVLFVVCIVHRYCAMMLQPKSEMNTTKLGHSQVMDILCTGSELCDGSTLLARKRF